ncbi:MAG TPA: Gfo/Idh/MocA family oxidoreductase [Frankiaceae bacterium]|nr:Gfo/Idh/MocA family oxidoreductase [Frankiaceae bacterium]
MRRLPELVAPGDRDGARDWRSRQWGRRARRPGLPLATAVVTDGADARAAPLLRRAGADVVGLLGPDPLESLAWAAEAGAARAYADLGALLSDRVEAVCVDLAPPASDVVARQAAGAGLHVLLARPRTAGAEALREVVTAAVETDVAHAVAFEGRAWPAVAHAGRTAAALGRLRQVTLLDMPAGETGRAEVVDLVLRWCGDVLAVCADPAAMPAPALAPGAPVTFALLTASGATVLVVERDGRRLRDSRICLSGAGGRVAVRRDLVCVQDAGGRREEPSPRPRPALLPAAHDLVRRACPAGAGAARGATLADLLAAVRVLEAAEVSAATGGWVEL